VLLASVRRRARNRETSLSVYCGSFGVLQKLRTRRDVARASLRWRLADTVSLAIPGS
jgi:hypothetical protein